ncbi:MAG: caspase family protein [Clostridia bacterium]|nr:caspase family protein [Clostridia bacterium]
MRAWRMLLLAVLSLLLWITAANAETRALLIGCDHFLSQQDTWPASHHNAEAMAAALQGLREPPSVTVTLPDGLSSADALAQAVQDAFDGVTAEDTCIFYVSTHGLWEEGQSAGDFSLLLSDGSREAAVTALELKRLLDAFPARKLLILDACHSGALIGKGVPLPAVNLFAGRDYLVLCSSGGMEDSFFWASDGESGAGAGFFTDCLIRGISDLGNAAADENRDSAVTLTELHRYLLASHGTSSAQAYPENSDEPIFLLRENRRLNRSAMLNNVRFETGALSIASPSISLSFTVLQPVRVGYQMIYQRGGAWDFDGAELIWDQPDLPGQPAGQLEPGYKERTVTLHTWDEEYGEGYVLLQLLAVRGEQTVIAASTVLCLPPSDGDPQLSAEAAASFDPSSGEEACIIVRHALPCELSVRLLDGSGTVVRRLATLEPTRPLQLSPTGTSFFWDGLLRDGTPAPDGIYTVRVSAQVGDELWEAEDVTLTLQRHTEKPVFRPSPIDRRFAVP